MLTDDDKKYITKTLSDTMHDLVIPAMDDMEGRINKRFDKLEGRVDSIERKLDVMTGQWYDHDTKIKNHELRIKKLEPKSGRSR